MQKEIFLPISFDTFDDNSSACRKSVRLVPFACRITLSLSGVVRVVILPQVSLISTAPLLIALGKDCGTPSKCDNDRKWAKDIESPIIAIVLLATSGQYERGSNFENSQSGSKFELELELVGIHS